MNLDPAQLEAAITKRTKAVMPVHLTGRICKMEQIQEIAGRHQIHVVEDAAQSVGASRKGKRAGCFGIAAGFSLHPLKNLFVHGDGGVVTTDSDELADRIRQSRNHGLKNRDEAEFWGINSRLDEAQAAIGLIKLRHIDQWNSRHREIAEYYSDALRGMVDVPVEAEDESSVYHRYMIRTLKRDGLAEYLAENGVETKVNYRVPLHLMPAAKESGYGLGSFPVCEKLADRILSLPVYSALEARESEYVAQKVSLYINQ
jgi:dTDP-4-amino-4,6-dideoxygalactose transaminase